MDTHPLRRAAFGLTLALLLGAVSCSGSPPAADIARIYDRIASDHEAPRNPVVLIPGVLGSRIEDSAGGVVWGAFLGDWADPHTPRGLRSIALPMEIGVPLAKLTDGGHPAGALEDLKIRILGLVVDIDAYVDILRALGIGGYRDQDLAKRVDYGEGHFTCFQFAYDWRRDVAESAALFGAFLDQKEAYLRTEYKERGIEKGPIRFDVVTHSLGGLVLRYYLRYGATPLPEDGSLPELTWSGARRIGRAVLVGPPNAGSLDSFFDLLEGSHIGPFLPTYQSALLGTMPAVYELLPRPRHGTFQGLGTRDPLAASTWEEMGWGLASPSAAGDLAQLLPDVADPAERRRIALDHQRKCLERARQLFRALDRPASPPEGLELILVAGDAEATRSAVTIDPATGSLGTTEHGPGDGTVLRASALLDERPGGTWTPRLVSPIDWSRVLFLPAGHLALTKSPAFVDNLLYLLLEDPRGAMLVP